ncbi:MAG: hypothetical protein PHV82_15370 [Victivallaceae bacterium]|nr:hypothetical protein [Victivallaceae bacterium]
MNKKIKLPVCGIFPGLGVGVLPASADYLVSNYYDHLNRIPLWGMSWDNAPAMIFPNRTGENNKYLPPGNCPELQKYVDRFRAGILRFIKAVAERTIIFKSGSVPAGRE